MSVKDVIKNGVYEAFSKGSSLSVVDILIILFVACLMGIYIYVLYRNLSKSSFYSKEINISLACLPLIVAAIMLAMQANLLVSLGMVGALSIVRFRTAIKSPLDLIYFFWGISEGIIVGVGLHLLGVLLCALITILLILLEYIPYGNNKAMLIIQYSKEDSGSIIETKAILNKYGKNREMSRIVKNGYAEVIFEIITKSKDELMNELQNINSQSISLVDYSGQSRC